MAKLKLYSNPWKNKKLFASTRGLSRIFGLKSRIKYFIRSQFYKWLLKKYCKGCKTVLDVGCGPGQFMKVAGDLGFKACGVDADERYKAKNVVIRDLWKADGKYDVVFSSMVIQLMDDQEKFVEKMASLSDKMVITISAYLSRSFYDTPANTKPVTKVSVRWLFRRNGFRNLLSMHIPFYRAVVVVSRKVTAEDNDPESVLIKKGFW